MDKKIALALIGIVAAVIGGGSFITYSNTVITTITGDTITDITTNLNIDLEALKKLCEDKEIPEKYKVGCEMLQDLT